jgi:hypothetical protein
MTSNDTTPATRDAATDEYQSPVGRLIELGEQALAILQPKGRPSERINRHLAAWKGGEGINPRQASDVAKLLGGTDLVLLRARDASQAIRLLQLFTEMSRLLDDALMWSLANSRKTVEALTWAGLRLGEKLQEARELQLSSEEHDSLRMVVGALLEARESGQMVIEERTIDEAAIALDRLASLASKVGGAA